jgi:putative flavoprotein involved in K+ transport
MGERVETIVVGGGQAGLAASYYLTQHDREHAVLERGRVGETWRTQRWDGFWLNTPNWTLQLPGGRYSGDEPDAFLPRDEIVTYLDQYARTVEAPVRLGVHVSSLRPRRGGGWLAETSDGEVEADNVLVATGAFQRPHHPPVASELPSDVLQLDATEYRSPERLRAGAVLVVGSGQSGCQIAEELRQDGRDVYLAVGNCPWLPRRYRGRDVLHWFVDLGLMDETVDKLPSPSARLACNPALSGNDGGHDCHPGTLARDGVRLLGRVEGLRGRKLVLGAQLGEHLAKGAEFAARLTTRIDEYVRDTALDAPPEPADGQVPAGDWEAVPELDLRAAGVGTILWASGYRPDFGWIDAPLFDGDGWPRQTRGVSDAPGLYFVGVHWLHKRKSALLMGVGEDAEHVVAHLVGVAPGR